MSHCVRYRHPTICHHLATQYVAGVMSTRVQQRTETLRRTVPELDRAIAEISDHFSELHQRLPEAELSTSDQQRVWQGIEQSMDALIAQQSSSPPSSFWQRLFVWRAISGVGALASVFFATLLFLINPGPATVGPSYLANMVAANSEHQAIEFVISAYAKRRDTPSQLHIQWLKSGEKQHGLHLWAEAKDTGQLQYIGPQPNAGQALSLTKSQWQAVANSHRLIMTTNQQSPSQSNTAFTGLCLQLAAWANKA